MPARKKKRRAAARKSASPKRTRVKKKSVNAKSKSKTRAQVRSKPKPGLKKSPTAKKPAPPTPTIYAGISDEAVMNATGKSWKQWLAILDKVGATEMSHKEIAEHLHDACGVGDWWSQMVTVGYEFARGIRRKHEKPDGYQISGSKTVTVPLERLFGAWNESAVRARWLGEFISIRKATPNKSMRITWSDGRTHVDAEFSAKGEDSSMVSVQHGKLPDARTAEKMKEYWAIKLDRLRGLLESV